MLARIGICPNCSLAFIKIEKPEFRQPEKSLKKSLFVLILISSPAFLDCRNPAKNYPVEFVDRNAALAPDRSRKPLLVVVEIDEAGNLRLNRIETGTIADASILTEKLRVIFADRTNTSIGEREVIIDPRGKVGNKDLEQLIENLVTVKASPIRVIKK